MFYFLYLNIFQFLKAQKNIQSDIYIKCVGSSYLSNKQRKNKEKKNFIKNAMIKFETKSIIRIEYIKTIPKIGI